MAKRKTQQVLQLLRDYESPNVTYMDSDGSWPIVWNRAQGVQVWDVEGAKYLDLTAAFGVAATGHANSRVIKAGAAQMQTLLHAMGDVHPHALKAELVRELSRLTFERWNKTRAKTILCNSGFEAVEAALKTAMLLTKRSRIIAFEQAYHGLGYGALSATHREHFRSPFRRQLREFADFVPFPKTNSELAAVRQQIVRIVKSGKIGAILLEPIQARGGINIPPPRFLPFLRQLCDQHGIVLILDEIYTGFGRTGRWFAFEHRKVVPDLICLGKALSGGFPISACVGRSDLMNAAWPKSSGEAIHTSTFLGHPVGCAMALSQMKEIARSKLVNRSARLGTFFQRELSSQLAVAGLDGIEFAVRGLGLMIGVELTTPDNKPATELALGTMKNLLHRGFIVLPEGEHANIISFTPPLVISEQQVRSAVRAFVSVLREIQQKLNS